VPVPTCAAAAMHMFRRFEANTGPIIFIGTMQLQLQLDCKQALISYRLQWMIWLILLALKHLSYPPKALAIFCSQIATAIVG
jgi:hypothetical protein